MVKSGLAIKALLAFAAAAYGIFLITRIPQATSINDGWTIRESETLRLRDPTPGDLILLDVRGAGLGRITADPGASIVEPTPNTLKLLEADDPDFQPRSAGSKLDVRFQNNQNSLTALSISTSSGVSDGTFVDVSPLVQQDDHGVNVQSPSASLLVSGAWASKPGFGSEDGAFLYGTSEHSLLLDRIGISVPSQKLIYIGATARSDLLFQLGSRSDYLSRGGLNVSSLEIRGGNNSTINSLACGAHRVGELRWPELFGGLSDAHCINTLRLEGFRLADKDTDSTVVLSGVAFLNHDGDVHYWPLLPNLTSNPVIQGAVTALIGIFIGWLFYRLGIKEAGKQEERPTTAHSGPSATEVRRSGARKPRRPAAKN